MSHRARVFPEETHSDALDTTLRPLDEVGRPVSDNHQVKKWSLLAGWFLVLVLATTLTWQIVSAADDQVSDRPIAP